MAKKEAPLDYLRRWIPDEAAQPILEYLNHYQVHLTITRERKSVLGDYRHATSSSNHRISINGNLNHYSFLITLIHELAHLVTFMEFGNRVQSHGREWKGIYRKVLEEFIKLAVFPADVLAALKKNLHDLPASSCADENLMRVLRRYDVDKEGLLLVEQDSGGGGVSVWRMNGVFRKGKKLRKKISMCGSSHRKVVSFQSDL